MNWCVTQAKLTDGTTRDLMLMVTGERKNLALKSAQAIQVHADLYGLDWDFMDVISWRVERFNEDFTQGSTKHNRMDFVQSDVKRKPQRNEHVRARSSEMDAMDKVLTDEFLGA